eukprot:1158308-Pelagomonas_calceolata.AAC.12
MRKSSIGSLDLPLKDGIHAQKHHMPKHNKHPKEITRSHTQIGLCSPAPCASMSAHTSACPPLAAARRGQLAPASAFAPWARSKAHTRACPPKAASMSGMHTCVCVCACRVCVECVCAHTRVNVLKHVSMC